MATGRGNKTQPYTTTPPHPTNTAQPKKTNTDLLTCTPLHGTWCRSASPHIRAGCSTPALHNSPPTLTPLPNPHRFLLTGLVVGLALVLHGDGGTGGWVGGMWCCVVQMVPCVGPALVARWCGRGLGEWRCAPRGRL